jgi:sulfiredoxin
METETLNIDDIYVPVKRRQTLDSATVESLADSILEDGQKTPISVRHDGNRFVLVEGLHRLEACRSLGETTIRAIIGGARQH